MSVTVKSISYSTIPEITNDYPHTFGNDVDVNVNIVKNNVLVRFKFTIRKGFKCDGASVPWMFRWFLPSWDNSNVIYNLGAVIHDGLYLHRGFNLFAREECDDILRGIWRESGIGRIKAGVADKCIELFAGCSKHFGNDGFGVGNLFEMDF